MNIKNVSLNKVNNGWIGWFSNDTKCKDSFCKIFFNEEDLANYINKFFECPNPFITFDNTVSQITQYGDEGFLIENSLGLVIKKELIF